MHAVMSLQQISHFRIPQEELESESLEIVFVSGLSQEAGVFFHLDWPHPLGS